MNPIASIRSVVRALGRDTTVKGARPVRARHMNMAGALALGLALAAMLPAAALAAGPPQVSTSSARHVSFDSATLTGLVNPSGESTSYYFQYGLTKAYGGQTTILGAGSGTHTVKVATAIKGLQPLSVYHF